MTLQPGIGRWLAVLGLLAGLSVAVFANVHWRWGLRGFACAVDDTGSRSVKTPSPVRLPHLRDFREDSTLLAAVPKEGVIWKGFIAVPRVGSYRFVANSDGDVEIQIDGAPVVNLSSERISRREDGTLTLTAGAHAISVAYTPAGGQRFLQTRWRPPGDLEQKISQQVLFARRPSAVEMITRRWLEAVAGSLKLVWLLIFVTGVSCGIYRVTAPESARARSLAVSGRPGVLHEILKRVALVLAATLVGALLAECLIRMFNVGPVIMAVHKEVYRLSRNHVLRYELVPNACDGAGTTINSNGLRDVEYAIPKPPGTFRIVCAGDSIAYGLGVEQSQTYAKCLERLLNTYAADRSIRFEVLNLGVPGYNAEQVVENCRVRGNKYEPDLVLYAYCLNDPQEYSHEFVELLANLSDAERTYAQPRVNDWFLLTHSRFYKLLKYELQMRTTRGNDLRPKVRLEDDPQLASFNNKTYADFFSTLHRTRATWRGAEEALDNLASCAREQHFSVCAFVFPVTTDLQPYPLKHVHKQVCKAFAQRDLHATDLLPCFVRYQQESGDLIYWDFLHPTAKGHRYAAMVMLESLLRNGLLPKVADDVFKNILRSGTPEERQFARWILELPQESG